MWPNLLLPADLAIFTEEILNRKLHFMCSEYGLISKEHQNNPFIGYVNINSLCNKINDLGKICRTIQIHLLPIDKTKRDKSFPDVQF